MLDEGEMDAVFVATPIGRHFDDGMKVLEAGIKSSKTKKQVDIK